MSSPPKFPQAPVLTTDRLAERYGYIPWTETSYKGFEVLLLRHG